MDLDKFRQLYVTELQELRSTEDLLVESLPKMADKANHPDLKQAIQSHLEETRAQRDRLDGIIARHDAEPRKHKDTSMQAIVREADRWADMVGDPDLRDAGLIASAQRVEHYEIAVYGTLATWAKQLGLDDDMNALLSILEEEKAADEKLTALAKRGVNPEAAEG